MFTTKEKASKLLCAVTCGFMIDCFYAIYQGVFVYKLNVAHGRAAGFVGHPMTLAGWACILLPVLWCSSLEKIFLREYDLRVWQYLLLEVLL